MQVKENIVVLSSVVAAIACRKSYCTVGDAESAVADGTSSSLLVNMLELEMVRDLVNKSNPTADQIYGVVTELWCTRSK